MLTEPYGSILYMQTLTSLVKHTWKRPLCLPPNAYMPSFMTHYTLFPSMPPPVINNEKVMYHAISLHKRAQRSCSNNVRNADPITSPASWF